VEGVSRDQSCVFASVGGAYRGLAEPERLKRGCWSYGSADSRFGAIA